MSDTENKDDVVAQPNELDMLKERAKIMGIAHSGNIGVDALRAKINAKLTGGEEKAEEDVVQKTTSEENGTEDKSVSQSDTITEEPIQSNESAPVAKAKEAVLNPLAGDAVGEKPYEQLTEREQIRRDALKLVRCRITNMDPKKADLPGEVLTIANRYIGTVKKFVPYGEVTDDGYHIPNCIYEELESRRFQNIRIIKDRKTGNKTVSATWAKEFAIEVLPPLTPEELAQLATAQIAAGSIDSAA
jgi:hypothetical protein